MTDSPEERFQRLQSATAATAAAQKAIAIMERISQKIRQRF